ncbi:MAG: hypothetical protein ACT4OO_03495 [Nitrospiraceae bacterium]
MLKPLVVGGLLGGLVLFVWGAVSWMVLSWHLTTLEKFADETAVAAVLTLTARQPGVYIFPNEHKPDPAMPKNQPQVAEEADRNRVQQAPFMFAAVSPQGSGSMGAALWVQLATQLTGAFLGTWLVLQTRGLTYFGRVSFLVILALTAAVLCHLPYWNWWHFSTSFTAVACADLLIGWFLAGLVIAKVAPVP